MPSARTRNRAVLYGLPWLAALAAVAAALVLPTTRANSLAGWILAGSIPFFGLPHGSADWWIMQRAAGPRWSRWSVRAGLAGVYVLGILMTLGLWYAQPGLALAGFIALTAWHFGSAEASVLLPDKAPLRDPVWWLFGVGRGLLVIFTSLAFWPAQSAAVLLPFASLGGDTAGTIAGLLRIAPYLLWLGAASQTLGLCLEIHLQSTRPDQRTLAWEGLETGVLLLLFRVAPPLLSFACYWVGFHAWRHLLRMEWTLHPDGPLPLGRAIVDFHRRTLPLTALSLFGLGLIFLAWPGLLLGSSQLIAAYLILLSALTVPHAVVVGWLDRDHGRATALVATRKRLS